MSFLQSWKDKVTQFVDVRLNLAKLAVIERSSNVLGYLIYTFILLFLLLAVFLFLGIGLQEWFSEMVDSRIGGAFMTMGFYLLLIILAVVLRKAVLGMFAGIFIRILTASDDDDEDYEARPHGRRITVEED